MNRLLRAITRTLIYAGSLLGLVITSWLLILTFPQPLFPYVIESEYVTIYSDEDLTEISDRIVADINHRLGGVPQILEGDRSNIFICNSQELFEFYSGIFFQPSGIQGFGPSVTDNFLMSRENIEAKGRESRGLPKYIKRQGDLGHAVTHELVHHYALNYLDLWTGMSIEFWKWEGYAEYGAHIANIKSDSTATIASRVDNLRNDRIWMGHDRIVKDTYRWALIIEYLIEVKGYDLHDITADSVTHDGAYYELMEWVDAG